jgi:hypothetical protein
VPANLNLQNITVGTGTTSYEASSTIDATTFVVGSGSTQASAYLQAGASIILQPGFHVFHGSTQLYLIAFQLANATAQPINAFRPTIPIFESHLDEALADINSKWAMALFTLTGLAGLQPDPQVIPVFYRMSDDPRLKEKALFALARLSPRPPEADGVRL